MGVFRYKRRVVLLFVAVVSSAFLLFAPVAKAQDTSTQEGEVKTCESTNTAALGWILCGIIETMDRAITALQNQIRQMLEISPKYYNDRDPVTGKNRIKEAWGNINQVATMLLVGVGLIMVIATALGVAVMDAYTIRKMLPRLILAVIGMQLSWYIMVFFIELTNDIGAGIASLIYAPFGGPQQVDLAKTLADAGYGGQGWFMTATVGALGISFLLGLTSFAFTALLAVIIGFVILLLRRMVIVALMVIAPLAIVSSILPNTDGFWKFWKGAFSKLLLMYPVVMVLIAAGRVFAHLASANDEGIRDVESLFDNLVQFVAVIIGYFGPYVGIPFAFRFVGGFAAQIGGLVNNQSRGAFDRLKKRRANNVASNVGKLKTGTRFNPRGAVGSRLNTFTQTAANMSEARWNPRQARARIAAATDRQNFAQAQEMMQKDAEFISTLSQDDDSLKALRANSRSEIAGALNANGRYDGNKAGLDKAVAQVQNFQRKYGKRAVDMAATMQLGATGTGFEDAGDFAANIAEYANGDKDLATRMIGTARSLATGARRVDQGGAGFSTTMGAVHRIMDADESGRQAAIDEAREAIHRGALTGSQPGAIVGAKRHAVAQLAPVMRQMLDEDLAINNNDPQKSERLSRNLATLAGRYDAMSQVAPENAEIMANEVMTHTINTRDMSQEMRDQVAAIRDNKGNITGYRPQVSVREAIDGMRNDQHFLSMRREYGSTAAAQANMMNQNVQNQLQQQQQQNPGGGPPGGQ